MQLHIHIYHHEQENKSLNLIINKLNQMAQTNQERFDELNTRLDTITNNIAEDYQSLLDQIGKGSISEESFAKHEANIARLEGIGASVENPVPEDPTPEP